MKIFVFLYINVLFALFTCNAKNTKDLNHKINRVHKTTNVIADSSAAANKAISTVSNLQEVINLEPHYKLKGRKAIILMQRPNKATPYFWIQVGISTPYRFEPIYNFYVSPKNYHVFFYNTITDSITKVGDWRKEQKKK